MKCVFPGCVKEALKDSNYCAVHQPDSIISMGVLKSMVDGSTVLRHRSSDDPERPEDNSKDEEE